MNHISETFTGIEQICDKLSSDEWKDKYHLLDYISDYYRLKIDNNREIFCAELPEYTGEYISLQTYSSILELSENNNIPYHMLRDITGDYRDMAYLYGYKMNNGKYEIVDLSNYKQDITRDILQMCNRWIKNKKYTTQQVYMMLNIVEKIYSYSSKDNSRFNSVQESMQFIKDVSNEVSDAYDRFEPEKRMEWNKFGGLLDRIYNDLHHECLKESARSKLVRDIKTGEVNIDEL